MSENLSDFEQLERRVLTAIFSRDKAGMTEMMHPDGFGFDATMGLVSQRKLIEGIDALEPGARFELDEVRVIPAGPDVTTLTYRLRQWGAFAGVPLPKVVYCSSIWRNGPEGRRTMFHHETPAV